MWPWSKMDHSLKGTNLRFGGENTRKHDFLRFKIYFSQGLMLHFLFRLTLPTTSTNKQTKQSKAKQNKTTTTKELINYQSLLVKNGWE